MSTASRALMQGAVLSVSDAEQLELIALEVERLQTTAVLHIAACALVVVTFEPSGMKLSLNRTSTGNLLRDFGDDDSDWIGKLVEIFVGEVTTNNGTMDAVLVRAVDAPAEAAKAKSSGWWWNG